MHAGQRDYWRCERCKATFLDPQQLPSAESEQQEYQLHQNDVNDDGYRRFLMRVSEPLLQRLQSAQQGLDYGCGPGPALADMLTQAGHQMSLYDPVFQPDTEALQRTYDFITCTEVAEHFHQPAQEFDRLNTLLKPGGWLAIMTSFQTDDSAFANWHYRRDPTHVVFYKEETFYWLASHYGWRCEIPVKNVALLQKRHDR